MNDGSCLKNLQALVPSDAEGFDLMEKVNTGAAVSLEGALVESPGQGQKWELKVRRMVILGEADPSYPCKRNGIRMNFCGPSRTCVLAPTNTGR